MTNQYNGLSTQFIAGRLAGRDTYSMDEHKQRILAVREEMKTAGVRMREGLKYTLKDLREYTPELREYIKETKALQKELNKRVKAAARVNATAARRLARQVAHDIVKDEKNQQRIEAKKVKVQQRAEAKEAKVQQKLYERKQRNINEAKEAKVTFEVKKAIKAEKALDRKAYKKLNYYKQKYGHDINKLEKKINAHVMRDRMELIYSRENMAEILDERYRNITGKLTSDEILKIGTKWIKHEIANIRKSAPLVDEEGLQLRLPALARRWTLDISDEIKKETDKTKKRKLKDLLFYYLHDGEFQKYQTVVGGMKLIARGGFVSEMDGKKHIEVKSGYSLDTVYDFSKAHLLVKEDGGLGYNLMTNDIVSAVEGFLSDGNVFGASTSGFRIYLQSMSTGLKAPFTFKALMHFERWLQSIFNANALKLNYDDKFVDDDSKKFNIWDSFKIDRVESIDTSEGKGGCNTNDQTYIKINSCFYEYTLLNIKSSNPDSQNCLFDCINHFSDTLINGDNYRTNNNMTLNEKINFNDAINICHTYNIIVIDIEYNQELNTYYNYIMLHNNHYYVVDSFNELNIDGKLDCRTLRGTMTFDIETRKSDTYDIIQATGQKIYHLKPTVACAVYYSYRGTQKHMTFTSNDHLCTRQFINFLNDESTAGNHYNIWAHNGGNFDYYFLLTQMTDTEIKRAEIQLRGTTIIKMVYMGHTFKDTCCFMLASLDSLCKDFKTKTKKQTTININGVDISSTELCFYKPELSYNSFMQLENIEPEFWSKYTTYCLYDCLSLMEIVITFRDNINNLIKSINPLLLHSCAVDSASTIGGHSKQILTAIHKYKNGPSFSKRFMQEFIDIVYDTKRRNVGVSCDEKKYKFIMGFKRGGISHCNKPGKYYTGITGVDIASQYPASMLNMVIPAGKSFWIENGKFNNTDYVYSDKHYGYFHLKNVVMNGLKFYPVAKASKVSLEWKFEKCDDLKITCRMLKYLKDNDMIKSYTIHDALLSFKYVQGDKIFGTYINSLYKLKAEQDVYKSILEKDKENKEALEKYNPAFRSVIKLYLNSLSGKMAEDPENHFVLEQVDEGGLTLNKMNVKKVTQHKINEWIMTAPCLYDYSKMILFDYINCLPNKEADVIHVETDGVYFRTDCLSTFTENLSNSTSMIKMGDALGNLKIEKTTQAHNVAWFIGKKNYCITTDKGAKYFALPDEDKANIFKVKGVPQFNMNADGSKSRIVDISFYNELWNGIDQSMTFTTLKKNLFKAESTIGVFEMTRTVKAPKNLPLYTLV